MKPPAYCRTQLSDRGNSFAFHNPATGKVDCNVAEISMGVEVHSGAQISASNIRVIGNDPSGPTGTALANDVFLSLGMVPGVDYVRLWKVDVQRVRDLLEARWYVVGYVDYGVIVDTFPRSLQGSRVYRGLHAIGMAGWWRKDGKRVVWEYDPLFDGRHSGYPLGRQVAPFGLLREAMGAYADGVGLVSGYAVKMRSL